MGRIARVLVPDWRAFLSTDPTEETLAQFRAHARTGRPLGSETFLRDLETQTGQTLLPRKRGPKPKREKGEER